MANKHNNQAGLPKHTILLVQHNNNSKSRSFADFPSVNLAMEGMVKMYEVRLKELNPSKNSVAYSIEDIYAYMDSLTDISALIYDQPSNMYAPAGKEWIKKKIFQVLKSQAS